MAKTGVPSAPRPSQASAVEPTSRRPAVAPIISTASVCSVIGTGQKGTCTLEASVRMTMPSPTAAALCSAWDLGKAVENKLPVMCMILRVMP